MTQPNSWRSGFRNHQFLLLLGFFINIVNTNFNAAPYITEDNNNLESYNIVLLEDTGGDEDSSRRFRREVISNNSDIVSDDELSETTTEHIDVTESSDEGYSPVSEDDHVKGSPRGHPLSKDQFIEDVSKADITDEQNKVQLTHKDYDFQNETDRLKYYNHEFHHDDGDTYYLDLDMKNKTGEHAGKVKEHAMLSQSYRRAATIQLSFKFPFYGHSVENITIATGGFLYTGDYVHSWLAATQYIAPLMANFDTSNNHDAKIRYLDDGSRLVVEWKDVYLLEKEMEGPFTFQVVLHKTGDIWFVYRTIPLEIISIKDEDHPVKVGLSDAYIIDRTIYFARRKTIYEYHRLNMKSHQIENKTAIVFQALPTCNLNTHCSSCLLARKMDGTSLGCGWCSALGECSDGTDRNRQDWLKKHCDETNISSIEHCPSPDQILQSTPSYSPYPVTTGSKLISQQTGGNILHRGYTASLVISILVSVLLISGMVWLIYAYFNPNTSSGRFLIKYRPGAWRWRHSGARYTAASIHM